MLQLYNTEEESYEKSYNSHNCAGVQVKRSTAVNRNVKETLAQPQGFLVSASVEENILSTCHSTWYAAEFMSHFLSFILTSHMIFDLSQKFYCRRPDDTQGAFKCIQYKVIFKQLTRYCILQTKDCRKHHFLTMRKVL